MSGHSKWSQIKRQKGLTDTKRGQLFTKLGKAVSIAILQGGGNTDLDFNFKLRLAVEKAHEANMPKENIDRAIANAKGRTERNNLDEAIYEAYGPAGVAIIIESTTDNKQRTSSEIKNILDKGGGRLVSPGAISYLFKYMGLLVLSKSGQTIDQMMERVIEAGGEDLDEAGEEFEIYTYPADLHKVKEKLTSLGFKIVRSELVFRPLNIVTLSSENEIKRVISLIESLESLDDVQKVFANFEIPDHILMHTSEISLVK